MKLISSPDAAEGTVPVPTRTEARNIVMATRLNPDEANYVQGAMEERGVATIAEFLRLAAIEYASR
jgi:hypothetical protein